MKTRSLCKKSMLAAAVGGMVLSFGAFADEGGKLQMMDTDKDGKVSASEHAAGARQMFMKMDANSDGQVTAAEMDAAHKDKPMKSTDKDGKPRMSSAEKISQIDTNGDGIISAAEHAEGSKAMFKKMDTDGDGYVTAAEMQTGHEQMMRDKE